MKLFLSSYRTDNYLERLLAMAGGRGSRMAIIPNAVDDRPEATRWEYYRNVMDPVAYFGDHGFDPTIVDLRMYFGRCDALANVMGRQSVIYAQGGNCFVLRRAMQLSGFDKILPEFLAAGVVYAGWSAGSCVAGTTLRVVEPMDEPNALGIGHPPGQPIYEGLGLVSYGIIPHYRSDHPESAIAEDCVALAEDESLPYRTLRDGEVVVIENGREELLGRQDQN